MEAVDLGNPNAPLIERVRLGEKDAREQLAREAAHPAYLFALQLLGDPEDARDVAQDSVIKLLRTLDRFDAQRPLRPWLFRIVRNNSLDLRRRRQVRRAQPLSEVMESEPGRIVDKSPGPLENAERRQLQERIWTALAAMPPDHRDILVLRDYQDLSYAEIARVLDVPKGTVMSRLHRARRHLRDELTATSRDRES